MPIEHWDFSKNEYMWTNYLYQMWGLNLAWMTVLGGLIYSWYPGMILNNWWWKLQCPQAAWTTDTITATTGLANGTATALTTPVGVNGWTQFSCLNAAPIK